MRNLFIAAVIVTTSFAALADGEAYANPQVAGSSITREQVVNEAKWAAAHSQLVSGESPSVSGMQAAAPQIAPRLSRAQVRAQLDAALRNGGVASGEFGTAIQTHARAGTQVAQR